MHQVNCTHCGRIVLISPDAPRCAVCGQDLHALIPEGYTAPYFYHRAADLAARGDLPSALAEVDRGLDYIESSELRLLAAIVAKRLGDMDTVRAHVAAIPVDDCLRQEAEWLLRSQPVGRSAQSTRIPADEPTPEPARAGTLSATETPTAAPSPLEGTTLANEPDDKPYTQPLNGPAQAASAPHKAGGASTLWAQRLWGMVALVLVLIAGAMGWTLLSGGPDALIALLPGLGEPNPGPIVQEQRQLQAVTPLPLVLPTPTPQGAAAQPAEPTVPADFVLAPTPEPVAASGLAAAAAGLVPATLDLPALLVNTGRADLAGSDVRASIDGSSVRLSGILTSTADRQLVIDLLQNIPAIADVNAVDLIVRIPATYTVQAGDSLWGIVGKFYGPDAARLTQLVELNSDALAGGQSLQIGSVLQLPPLE